ncbi:MAG: glycosyltransferase family 4 protein [Bacteroidota bacterium]|nr:glycosyltransferase family 4 protein [Bacteroidota bacterium]
MSVGEGAKTSFGGPPLMLAPSDRRVVAFVTFTGLKAEGSWPATAASMVRALEELGHTVIRINPTGPDNPLMWKVIQGLYRIAGLRFQSERQEAVIRQLAGSVNKQLQGNKPDLLLSSSSLALPFLDVDCPMAFWTDATFSGMLGFYPEFSKLSKITRRNGLYFETLALKRAEMAIYSSDWAARSAVNDHGADPAKVFVIPFGPNLSKPPLREPVLECIAKRSRIDCNLLFIGYDWERKQGPLVVKVHQELLRRSMNSKLTIVGCEPDLDRNMKGIQVLGLLNKELPEHDSQLKKALCDAHFMIVPSRAECYGMVYAEASAYGIPSIGCDVGGVSTVIISGSNGMLFPLDASPAEIADHIEATWSDRSTYERFATMARNDFDERLNWPTAVTRLFKAMDALQVSPV